VTGEPGLGVAAAATAQEDVHVAELAGGQALLRDTLAATLGGSEGVVPAREEAAIGRFGVSRDRREGED
jgi:hypothetical protein